MKNIFNNGGEIKPLITEEEKKEYKVFRDSFLIHKKQAEGDKRLS